MADILADLIHLLFNWLSVSSFYLAFYFLIDSSISTGSDPFGGAGADIFAVFNKVYIGLMYVQRSASYVKWRS